VNDDELRHRLKAADPATPSPATSWIPDLVEATMNTPIEHDKRGRSWLLPLAAAAAVAVLAVGGFAVLNDDDGSEKVAAEPTSVTLTVPGGDAMNSCMMFDPAFLKDAEIAFSGTVAQTDDASVTLDVDRWYQGGDADQVVLEHSGANTQVALDGVDFADGKRYLVSASDGMVTTCGYSGPWTEEFAAQFDQAFGS
jgi:hypothetical protein